jgi:hypothetical protein
MPTHDSLPETFSEGAVVRLAQYLVTASRTGDLRYLGIGMLAWKFVPPGAQRLEHRMMMEAVGRIAATLVAGARVQIDQHLAHAAVLDLQHGLHLLLAQSGGNFVRPVGQLQCNLFGLSIAAEHPGVAQARENLVLRVPGDPRATFEDERILRRNLAPFQSAQRLELERRQRSHWATRSSVDKSGRSVLPITPCRIAPDNASEARSSW